MILVKQVQNEKLGDPLNHLSLARLHRKAQ